MSLSLLSIFPIHSFLFDIVSFLLCLCFCLCVLSSGSSMEVSLVSMFIYLSPQSCPCSFSLVLVQIWKVPSRIGHHFVADDWSQMNHPGWMVHLNIFATPLICQSKLSFTLIGSLFSCSLQSWKVGGCGSDGKARCRPVMKVVESVSWLHYLCIFAPQMNPSECLCKC